MEPKVDAVPADECLRHKED